MTDLHCSLHVAQGALGEAEALVAAMERILRERTLPDVVKATLNGVLDAARLRCVYYAGRIQALEAAGALHGVSCTSSPRPDIMRIPPDTDASDIVAADHAVAALIDKMFPKSGDTPEKGGANAAS